MRAEELLESILATSPMVRAASIYPGSGEPVYRPRGGADPRRAGGEYWEEAVVNPTLIDLLRRTGAARHEGLDYLLVRYRDGWLLLLPFEHGHAAIAFEPTADPIPTVPTLRQLCEHHGFGFAVVSWDRG